MGILSRESNAAFYFIFGICTFFIWCDLSFFGELSEKELIMNGTKYGRKPPSIKLRMQDHVDHYIYLPFCNWLEKTFKISEIPGVTPNALTTFHFCLAIFCAKLMMSQELVWRRLAVILYETRSCIDIMDGVVFRAQQRGQTSFSNGWGTFGYYFDAGADIVGGLGLAIAVTVLFTRHLPSKTNKSHDLESGQKLLADSGSADEHDDGTWGKRVSRRTVYITIFLFVVQVITRSGLWDHFLHSYHQLLEAPMTGVPRVSSKLGNKRQNVMITA